VLAVLFFGYASAGLREILESKRPKLDNFFDEAKNKIDEISQQVDSTLTDAQGSLDEYKKQVDDVIDYASQTYDDIVNDPETQQQIEEIKRSFDDQMHRIDDLGRDISDKINSIKDDATEKIYGSSNGAPTIEVPDEFQVSYEWYKYDPETQTSSTINMQTVESYSKEFNAKKQVMIQDSTKYQYQSYFYNDVTAEYFYPQLGDRCDKFNFQNYGVNDIVESVKSYFTADNYKGVETLAFEPDTEFHVF
jgi:ElaB/YqjD/DUF883 family membrane-anchored ribosome-binding protein